MAARHFISPWNEPSGYLLPAEPFVLTKSSVADGAATGLVRPVPVVAASRLVVLPVHEDLGSSAA